MLNLTHRYAMRNMTKKRLDEVRKTNMTPSVLTYRGMKMTKDELLKVIRDALPCPYGTSVDVQIDDNGDVHIEMILLKPHQPFNLEDANSGSKTWMDIKKDCNLKDNNVKAYETEGDALKEFFRASGQAVDSTHLTDSVTMLTKEGFELRHEVFLHDAPTSEPTPEEPTEPTE